MDIELTEEQQRACDLAVAWFNDSDEQVFRIFGPAGCGKAQPLTCKVQTPMGPVEIGSLNAGDDIFGVDGSVQKVNSVHPQGLRQPYKVTFRDKTSTLCCEDHLWTLRRSNRPDFIKTTKQMMDAGLRRANKDYKWKIPLCSPVEYSKKDYIIPPYVMGVLLGDGYISAKQMVMSVGNLDLDIADRVEFEISGVMGVTRKQKEGCIALNLTSGFSNANIYRDEIRRLGVDKKSLEKFIPEIYLRGSIEQRVDLLRGLMDSDGSSSGNRISFSTISPLLASDIQNLTQSLGGTAIIRSYDRSKDEKGIEYDVNIKVLEFNPFYTSRKAKNWKPSTKNPPSRYIHSIEQYGDPCEHVCISVSNEDSLYLTDNYIATHNTTLARSIVDKIKTSTLYGAYTGKAAIVMQKNGCHGASTLHSLLYTFQENHTTGEMIQFLDKYGPLSKNELLVVDEVSFVGKEMGEEILSFGKKVLVLGDPYQLPPIDGAGFFTSGKPDVLLKEIHRQAKESPIIQLATIVREGGDLDYGIYGNCSVISKKDINAEIILAADQVIVGLNKTRKSYNKRIRQLKDIYSDIPIIGEKLICLKNDKNKGICNGEIFECVSSELGRKSAKGQKVRLSVKSKDFETRAIKVNVFKDFFNGDPKNIDWRALKGTQQFDYGYAVSCHKFQGSQAKDIVMFDESWAFREHAMNWAYTAITRAEEKITIVI